MKKVSVIIPCRNEEKDIRDCLHSIRKQTYPIHEIIVIDGRSTDKSRDIVRENKATLLHSARKTTQYAINMGFEEATGDYIITMDAHSTISSNYVYECIKVLEKHPYAVVGGRTVSVPGDSSLIGRCIAELWNHPFGKGLSHYRQKTDKLREVTSMHGIMKSRKILEEVGYYNEKLTHSHDIEWVFRARSKGVKILQTPGINTYYIARPSHRGLINKAWIDGQWVILPRKLSKFRFLSTRHFVPLLFVLTLPVSIWPYLVLNTLRSFQSSQPTFIMMPLFFSWHFVYGLGSLYGLFKLLYWRIKDEV